MRKQPEYRAYEVPSAQPHEWQHGGAPHGFGPPPAYGFGPPPPPYGVRPADPERDRHAFVAPMIASVLAAPVIVVGGMFTMISPMATDSCTAHGCQALYRMLLLAPCLLVLAAGALGASWAVPWRRRHRAKRIALAALAPLLALAAAMIYLHLPAAT